MTDVTNRPVRTGLGLIITVATIIAGAAAYIEVRDTVWAAAIRSRLDRIESRLADSFDDLREEQRSTNTRLDRILELLR